MNITFLIGNGFDLNLNLNTRYSDFYKYYMEHNPNDLLSKSIEKDCEMWSDLEIGLGKFLQSIDETQIPAFLDSKSTLELLLSDYLLIESQKVKITDKKALSKEFCNKILNFFLDFNALEKEHYKHVITTMKETINYSFITFNYTNLLDDIVELAQKNCDSFGHRLTNNVYFGDTISLPYHIHGRLTGDLILGIDNKEQILNEKLKNNDQLTNYIIKSSVNNALGEKKIEKVKKIIDKSKYVCLFGLSIGDTDAMWWAYIIEWLKRDKDNRLVLFTNEKSKIQVSGQEKIRFRNTKRKFMFDRSKCNDPEIRRQIQDKIIIVQNSKIFNLENITK